MCVKDTKNSLGRFTWLNKQGVEYVRDKILKGQIEDHVNSVLKSKRTYRILDIGCGDFPYLRENAYSENADSEELLSIFYKKTVEIRLIDPDTKISIPKGWKDFAELFPCRFYHFLEDGKYREERTKKFDLIILSAVPHELYLEWCLSRVTHKSEEENLKKVAIPSCCREEFCYDLFRKLSTLLNDGGYILLVENYCPKRVKQETQLLAQQVQYEVMNHADSPSAFFPTEDYVAAAKKLGFKCDFQDSVRCVNVGWIENHNNQDSFAKLAKSWQEDIRPAFESRRFGCKLIRKNPDGPSDLNGGNDSELHRGFLFDMSSVVNFDELDKVLHEWVDAKTCGSEINIKTKYKDVFWGRDQSANGSVFAQLIKKCYDVVKSTFSYEVITYPKLFSCWVSVNSLVTGGRFSAIDDIGHMTPIVYTPDSDKGVKVYMRESNELKDWNEIAFNSFSSIHALEELLSESGLDDNAKKMARSPSVYNYMRHTPSVRSLTLTYARQLCSCQGQHISADIQLANQEDAINALELGHWQSKVKDQKHRLIVIDFEKVPKEDGTKEDDTDPCLRAAEEINKYMSASDGSESGGYYTEIKDKSYVRYLTAIYLDFLFLRRFENEEVDINNLIISFNTRWCAKIQHDFVERGDGVGRNFIKMITEATKVARNKAFEIDKLPRAFITFSSPIYLDEDGDKASADSRQQPPGSMMIFTDKIFPKDALDSMVAVTERTFDVIRALELKWVVEKRNQELRLSNTKSAIGSIMSRNGSHNIGSHVLAALSHNVGTMPDDRVLYQYIQHRMDHIATATTGFPDWGVPTMLVGEIMRNFMVQHHLLDHIVESEGLHAYHFQGHNAYTEENQRDALRIRIVSIDGKNEDGSDREYPFISYPLANVSATPDSGSSLIDDKVSCADAALHDVRVAIPGGVAGHHAIYTILENIIRNAAKHGWANGTQSKPTNLEITIRFEKTDNDRVRIVVFDNVGKTGEELGNLVVSINEKLDARLISDDEDGGLRQENWGMAEMRISAAYLQRRSLAETGGLEKLAEDDFIIKAVPVDDKYLGYEFHVSTPKEMLLVMPSCGEDHTEGPTWSEIRKSVLNNPAILKNLDDSGIHLAFEDEKDGGYYELVQNEKKQVERRRVRNMQYEYVILPAVPKDLKVGKYPFRILVLDKAVADDRVWEIDDAYTSTLVGNQIIPSIWQEQRAIKQCFSKIIDGTGNCCDLIQEVKNRIYLVWLQYLEKRTRNLQDNGSPNEDSDEHIVEDPRNPRDISILVDTTGKSRNSGQGLISDYDVCKYIIEHVWGTVLEEINMDGVAGGTMLKQIFEEKKLSAVGFFNRTKRAEQKSKVHQLPSKERKKIFQEVIELMLTELMSGGINHAEQKQLKRELVKRLADSYSATHALLRKYAEKIDTLPGDFCEAQASGCCRTQAPVGHYNKHSIEELNVPEFGLFGEMYLRREDTSTEYSINENKFTITYCRHGDDTKRSIYRSGLSGSQSCFSQLQHLEYCPDGDKGTRMSMFASLVENALLRVLIVDERVCRFLSDRKRIVDKLQDMNVWAVNTDMKDIDVDSANNQNSGEPRTSRQDDNAEIDNGLVPLLWKSFKECALGDSDFTSAEIFRKCHKCNEYDVLIIHQGIIDKLLGESCNAKRVESFLNRLKRIIPYVVITTGRGRPSNTPASARILPFPCVERYLFQEWPEKFLLINSIMNLLPCGASNANI